MCSKRRLRRKCERKSTYKTIDIALYYYDKYRTMYPDQFFYNNLAIYKCQFCKKYHIGRRKTDYNLVKTDNRN